MKRRTKMLIFTGYLSIVITGFWGIKRFEAWAKDTYYQSITRRLVSQVSKISPDNCILGIYKPELPYSFGPLQAMEDSLGKKFTLISWYQAWGDKAEHRFPAEAMEAAVTNGRVPMITWEPWITEFAASHLKPLSEREHRYLKDIAEGAYDFYIREWAKAAVTWGKPFFLRFAHEMTNHQYPWSDINGNRADDYIHAWRHVHSLFDSLGARNVVWVWCPYKAGSLNYYPGHEYVDWVAIDIFNYGDLLSEDAAAVRWMSFDQLTSPIYDEVSALRKPIMVAEVGSSDMGGSREVWYREMFGQVATKYTNIKALVLFNDPSDRTSGRWIIDWSVDGSPEIMAETREALANDHYVFIPDYIKLLSTHNKR